MTERETLLTRALFQAVVSLEQIATDMRCPLARPLETGQRLGALTPTEKLHRYAETCENAHADATAALRAIQELLRDTSQELGADG